MRGLRAVTAAAAALAVPWLAPPHAGPAQGAGPTWGAGAPVPAAARPTLPDGFTDHLVTAVPAPTAAAFTPDGRLLVTTQPGRLFVHHGQGRVADPALDLTEAVCTRVEQGLLGIAVDPAFGANGHVYLYYTFDHAGCVNRVSRFTMTGDRADPASEVVLLDNIPSPNANHVAGDLQFGPDGFLYVSVGDGGCDYDGGGCAGENDAARDRHVLLGKILRLTTDGAPAPGNPFAGPGSARCNRTGRTEPDRWCAETFVWGLRNPFRMAFDPDADGTRLFVNDVGQDHWEEIDDVRAGADYGWNLREGHCANGSRIECGPAPDGMTDPVFDYHHTTRCTAITGGAFVPRGAWPGVYDGAYLFADFTCGTIFRLVEGPGGYTSEPFATGLGLGSAVHLLFGPGPSGDGDRALYYTTYGRGGQVRRVDHTGAAPRRASYDSGTIPARG